LFLAGKDEASIQRVEQNSMGCIAETANITPTVAFLVSDTAGWVNWQVIKVNSSHVHQPDFT
jgi:hypothetical protein